jgi:hypothetical protein
MARLSDSLDNERIHQGDNEHIHQGDEDEVLDLDHTDDVEDGVDQASEE